MQNVTLYMRRLHGAKSEISQVRNLLDTGL